MLTVSTIVKRNINKTKDLNTFEHGKNFGARRMGHSISEIVQTLDFSPATVSRVYREYVDSSETIQTRDNYREHEQPLWMTGFVGV